MEYENPKATGLEKSMSLNDFLEACAGRNDIGVQLDWEGLAAAVGVGRATISCRTLGLETDLSKFFAPWYRTPYGEETSYLHQDGKPWSFADLLVNMPDSHAEKIDYLAGNLRGEIQIVSLSVGDDMSLVLDGNHRLAAWARTQETNHIPYVNDLHIRADPSLGLVPDMVHWSH